MGRLAYPVSSKKPTTPASEQPKEYLTLERSSTKNF